MRFVTVGGQNLCLVVPGSNQTQQLVSIQSFTWMALQRSFGPDARPAQRFLFCNYNFVVRYSNQTRCGDPSAPDPTHAAPSETNQRSGEPLRSWPIESVAWWSAEEEKPLPLLDPELNCSRISPRHSYPRNVCALKKEKDPTAESHLRHRTTVLVRYQSGCLRHC